MDDADRRYFLESIGRMLDDPKGFMREHDPFNEQVIHPMFGKVAAAIAEVKEAEEQKAIADWAGRYGLEPKSRVTEFLWNVFHHTFREIRENQDGFAGRLVELGQAVAVLHQLFDAHIKANGTLTSVSAEKPPRT